MGEMFCREKAIDFSEGFLRAVESALIARGVIFELVQAAEKLKQMIPVGGFGGRPVACLHALQIVGVDELFVVVALRQGENGLAEMEGLTKCLIAGGADDSGAIGEVVSKSLFVDLAKTEVALGLMLAESINMDVAIAGGEHFQHARRRGLSQVGNEMGSLVG